MLRLLCCALLFAPSTLAQESQAPLTSGRPAPPEQTCFDVKHYFLDVKVQPETKSIEGSVLVQAELLAATDAVILDLHEALTVASVGLDVARGPNDVARYPAPFEHREGEIHIEVGALFETHGIEPGDVFVLSVDYGGAPRVAPRAPWDGGFQWERTPSGAHWIATSNQMQGADLWWPCKDQPDDEPDTMSLRIHVPEGLTAVSNGRFIDSTTKDGWSTYQWFVTTPINTYGVALNIAPYEVIEREIESTAGDTFLASYWVLPENVEKGKVLFEDFVRQIRWHEETFGPYPFRADKAGLVETPHLGMEHQSVTAYGNEYRGNPWGEDQGFDFLLHHEFAHEYWANLVTCRNWKDFWIHESFGTYAQALYCESLNGAEGYRKRMLEIRRGHRNRAPIAPREPMSTADVYFGATGGDIYNKGAWVLHTLRWVVGDEDFFVALRRMAYPDPTLEGTTDGSACRFSDTEEIRAIAETHTKQDLKWFFELYLRQPAIPKLEQTMEGGVLTLRWVVPEGLSCPMPLEVEIDGERTRLAMKDGSGNIDVPEGASVVIDPDGWILKEEERAGRRRER